MGFFDKKYCDVCGEKIGLLGNRKLEDGNLCKNCAKKLSPWFNERRHSTVDEIKMQLNDREANRQKVAQFRVTRTMGESWKVLLDETAKQFTVTHASTPNVEENPDVLDFSAITGCRVDIDENRTEIFRSTSDGKKVSYEPPRYEYTYYFDMIIHVSTPYFDEIRFRLNSSSVVYRPQPAVQISLFGRSLTDEVGGPENCPEYRKYRDMGEEICRELDRVRGVGFSSAPVPVTKERAAVPNTTDAWSCQSCGAQNSGKFCEGCGNPRPVARPKFCSNCGWSPEPSQPMPKFCPECGNMLGS